MKIIGIDFSIKKPAACVFPKFSFYSWPLDVHPRVLSLMDEAGVHCVSRMAFKKEEEDLSIRIRRELQESIYLSELIIETLRPHLDGAWIAIEGVSYSSAGNVGLQLSSYKMIFLRDLLKYVPLQRIFVYSPPTIKKTAGCSAKGKKKVDMVDAFVERGESGLSRRIKVNPQPWKKKTGSWVDHLDDLSDAYWTLQCFREKISPQ